MQIFQEIEENILALLQETKEIGVKTIDFYAGQLAVQNLADYSYQYPFLYIGNASLKFTPVNQTDKGVIDIGILIGDRNIRGLQGGKLGDQSSPGVYAIMEKTFGLLHGYKPAEQAFQMFMQSSYPIAYEESLHICVYVQEFTIDIINMR